MARNYNIRENGNAFDEQTIEAVWQKGKPELGLSTYRKDVCGASMQRQKHGKQEQYG